jgi:hypothetical protein
VRPGAVRRAEGDWFVAPIVLPLSGRLGRVACRGIPLNLLARACGLSPPNASSHLQCLIRCGLARLPPKAHQSVYSFHDRRIGLLLDQREGLVCSRVGGLIQARRNYRTSSRRALRGPHGYCGSEDRD